MDKEKVHRIAANCNSLRRRFGDTRERLAGLEPGRSIDQAEAKEMLDQLAELAGNVADLAEIVVKLG